MVCQMSFLTMLDCAQPGRFATAFTYLQETLYRMYVGVEIAGCVLGAKDKGEGSMWRAH